MRYLALALALSGARAFDDIASYTPPTDVLKHLSLDKDQKCVEDALGEDQGHTWCTPTPCTSPSVHR